MNPAFFFKVPVNHGFFVQEWVNFAFFLLGADESCGQIPAFFTNEWVNLHFFISDSMNLAYPSLNSCLFRY
jgi:hypothetical protein